MKEYKKAYLKEKIVLKCTNCNSIVSICDLCKDYIDNLLFCSDDFSIKHICENCYNKEVKE